MADSSSAKTIVLITGANSGVGLELAAYLLAKGTYHILLGARDAEKGHAAVEDLQSRGLPGTVFLLQVDVTDDASIEAAAHKVEQEYHHVDVLVNNAGRGGADVEDLREGMNICFHTNAIGPAKMGEVFKPLLLKSSSPLKKIVNVSGGGSISRVLGQKKPDPHYSRTMPYRASKAALHMVNALQLKEFEPHGIKVLLWTPPFTVSNLGPHNKAENGAEPVGEATKPLVHLIEGGRDSDQGKFLFGYDEVLGW